MMNSLRGPRSFTVTSVSVGDGGTTLKTNGCLTDAGLNL